MGVEGAMPVVGALRGVKVFVDEVVVENFKSIRRVVLRLVPGVNVLVGPNASGKTNVLEALYFLRRALVDELDRAPYMPHAPTYWSPIDLVYGRSPLNPIVLRLGATCYDVSAGVRYRLVFGVEFRVSPDQSTVLPSRVELGYGDDTIVAVSYEGVEVRVREGLLDAAREFLEARVSELEREGRREGGYVVYRYSHPYAEGDAYTVLRLARLLLAPPFVRETVSGSRGIVVSSLEIPPLTRLRAIPVVYRVEPIEAGEAPKGFELRSRLEGHVSPGDLRWVLSRVMLLKHPDVGSLREPKIVAQTDVLDVRASNLAPVLLSLVSRYGAIPPRISEALKKLFPGTRLRLATQYGRVAIEVEEDGLELPPANVADGLLKVLAILTAIELKPSILLIDELENSMHAQLIEYVVDELNSLEIPVLVATHSPIVVDLVGPERTLVVERKPGEGTTVSRIEQPEELARKLDELGIAFSDYIFYRRTRVDA